MLMKLETSKKSMKNQSSSKIKKLLSRFMFKSQMTFQKKAPKKTAVKVAKVPESLKIGLLKKKLIKELLLAIKVKDFIASAISNKFLTKNKIKTLKAELTDYVKLMGDPKYEIKIEDDVLSVLTKLSSLKESLYK
jgi:hypothetical protein